MSPRPSDKNMRRNRRTEALPIIEAIIGSHGESPVITGESCKEVLQATENVISITISDMEDISITTVCVSIISISSTASCPGNNLEVVGHLYVIRVSKGVLVYSELIISSSIWRMWLRSERGDQNDKACKYF